LKKPSELIPGFQRALQPVRKIYCPSKNINFFGGTLEGSGKFLSFCI
jgi:hypothetical protein